MSQSGILEDNDDRTAERTSANQASSVGGQGLPRGGGNLQCVVDLLRFRPTRRADASKNDSDSRADYDFRCGVNAERSSNAICYREVASDANAQPRHG